MRKLWKVECYRFLKNSIDWVAVAIMLSAMLFLSAEDTDMLLGDHSLVGTITSTLKIANLYIILAISVEVAIYIGREFRQKTICYEIMRGYSMWKISLVKAMTCGLMNAALLQVAILIYVLCMGGTLHFFAWGRWVLMFLILCHICTGITLYIMLFRDGGIGGCMAFVRFTLLTVVGMFASELFLPDAGHAVYMALSPMSQWSVVIDAAYAVPVRYIIGIPISFLLESIILLGIIQVTSKKVDF